MKRILFLLLTCLVLTSLFSCGESRAENESNGPVIVSTIFPPYDFAREITGGEADISILLPAGGDPHSYEPTPKEIIKVKNCDLFIYIGGESDEYIRDILASFENPPKSIALMDYVGLLDEEITEGMESDGEEAEENGTPDEHIWTSLDNCVKMCEAIKTALSEVSPESADKYEANCYVYTAKLKELDAEFLELGKNSDCKTLVFGDRFPFRYFAERYGFEYYAAFPGCSGESEPSAATVAFLLNKVRDENIPTVFYTETSSGLSAKSIAEQSGAEYAMLHSCHNITNTERENGTSFLFLMEKNLEILKGAMQTDGNN